MRVAVALDALRQQVADYGSIAYLVTMTGEERPHLVSVRVRWEGSELVSTVGGGTAGNASARPAVSLLWPPTADGHYCLIVDGLATVRARAGEDGQEVAVDPTRAVLHRLPVDEVGDGAEEPGCIPVLKGEKR
jgi:hypothetical protein